MKHVQVKQTDDTGIALCRMKYDQFLLTLAHHALNGDPLIFERFKGFAEKSREEPHPCEGCAGVLEWMVNDAEFKSLSKKRLR